VINADHSICETCGAHPYWRVYEDLVDNIKLTPMDESPLTLQEIAVDRAWELNYDCYRGK